MRSFTAPETIIRAYDAQRFDFAGILARLLGTDDLTTLTTDYESTDARDQNSLYKNMEHSPHFRRLYAGLNGSAGAAFYELYHRFVREEIRPHFDEPIYYQTRPSHRILFADTPGESRFHRDRDYGHSSAEINFWVPQTPAAGNNTIWLESVEGRADYRPQNLQPGEYLQFHGADLSHGARRNDTGRSRVSFDFRVLPASQMQDADQNGGRFAASDNPVRGNARKFSYCA